MPEKKADPVEALHEADLAQQTDDTVYQDWADVREAIRRYRERRARIKAQFTRKEQEDASVSHHRD